tara:strand:- start:391 stop:558 length:168 start_codon:yes stop_codon:yes gene_type:complete
MAYEVQHLSASDFKINGHYVYKDANGNWISNPPIDSSNTNLNQAVTEIIKSLERV